MEEDAVLESTPSCPKEHPSITPDQGNNLLQSTAAEHPLQNTACEPPQQSTKSQLPQQDASVARSKQNATSERPRNSSQNVRESTERGAGGQSDEYTIREDQNGCRWKVRNTFADYDVYTDIPSHIIGHLCTGASYRFLVSYGKEQSYSMRFESPSLRSDHYSITEGFDVVLKANRIIEPIVDYHLSRRLPLPMDILSKAVILCVYWDSKHELGRAAEFDVLDPYTVTRSNTRCYVYLDPSFYQDRCREWGISNKTGWSHETKTKMRYCLGGRKNHQRDLSLYNKAVQCEEGFEKECMSDRSLPAIPIPELTTT